MFVSVENHASQQERHVSSLVDPFDTTVYLMKPRGVFSAGCAYLPIVLNRRSSRIRVVVHRLKGLQTHCMV